MGLFSNRRKAIDVSKNLTHHGIAFELHKEDSKLELPTNLAPNDIRRLSNIDTLMLLEDLFYEQWLLELDNGQYLLHYDTIYELDKSERQMLDLPSQKSSLQFHIKGQGIIGKPDFELKMTFSSGEKPRLDQIGNRTHNIIEVNDEWLLITDHDRQLMDAVKEFEDKEGEEVLRQFSKIKSLAQDTNVTFDSYLDKENFEFIETVEPTVEKGHEGIEFKSKYSHSGLDSEVLENSKLLTQGYTKHDKGRVFVDKETQESAQKIEQLDPIPENEVPHFVNNPEGYMENRMDEMGIDFDEITLENFSERVKDLGVKVYQAQPYIHGNESDRGWFDYDIGYQIKDEFGETLGQESLGYFESDQLEDFKKIDDDTYISVPDQVNEFEESAAKLKEREGRADSKQYVIEIYENIQSVEFNAPIQEIRQQMEDANVHEETPPAMFKATLHPFQTEGFVWMKRLYFMGYGGLLADDMGLGKTVQVIAFLTHLKENKQLSPTLLVLPKALIDNWVDEIDKFANDLTNRHYKHLGKDRFKTVENISRFDVVLTTYDTLVRDQFVMGQIDWQFVIADEAQKIKNPSTSTSKVIKALKNKGRLALTGTPVENNLTELWSITDFVQPGLLGSLKEFKQQFEEPIKQGQNYDEVQKKLEDEMEVIYKRRTKQGELEDQLPKKIEHHSEHNVSFGKQQEALYGAIIQKIHNKEIEPLNGIQELKKISSHPGLIDDNFEDLKTKDVPKLEKTIEILRNIKSKKEKALIFTEYRKMQTILIKKIAEEFNLKALVINGATNARQKLVDRFNDGEGFNVLILSPQAAGVGLTITSANHVIHYTRWWNPAIENQATDRVYRIGQEKDVHVYYPMVTSHNENSFEEIVDRLLTEKSALAENVIVPSRHLEIEEELEKAISN